MHMSSEMETQIDKISTNLVKKCSPEGLLVICRKISSISPNSSLPRPSRLSSRSGESSIFTVSQDPSKVSKKIQNGLQFWYVSTKNHAKASSRQLSKKRLKGNECVLVFVSKRVPESGSNFEIFLRFSGLLALRVPEGVGSGSKDHQSGLRQLKMSSCASILVYKIPRGSG